MSHILLLELPGANDFTVLQDAVEAGHEVTFVTGDLAHYRNQGQAVQGGLSLARDIIDINPYDYAALEARALAIHARHTFDAILCILDIRMIDASRLAARLGLRVLNPATARLVRDKTLVRKSLAQAGLRQPRFAVVERAADLPAAVAQIGYPALIKPVDGFGSQNLHMIRSDADLSAVTQNLAALSACPADYGLGIAASNRHAVEACIEGHLIGCDIFSRDGQHLLLGINDKLMFPSPSFAIRGSCFPTGRHDLATIGRYAFAILDAIGFDFGASHIEMIVAPDGPYLVEVNPRLVSAQIPFQMGHAFGHSVYLDLIDLHLGRDLAEFQSIRAVQFSAIRWLVADRAGFLEHIALQDPGGPAIRRAVLFKQPGDPVRPPLSNGDRLGYVIAVGATQEAAEAEAEQFIAACRVNVSLACAA